MTRYVKIANTENLCFDNKSVNELTEVLPEILSTRNSKIILHIGSFDILHKKTGTETLKEDFTKLMNTVNNHQMIISGPIACYKRGPEAFSRLLNLNTWLMTTCLALGLRFIDNFNVFWNCADRFHYNGLLPNRFGTRMLAANIHHALVTFRNIDGLSHDSTSSMDGISDKHDVTRAIDMDGMSPQKTTNPSNLLRLG